MLKYLVAYYYINYRNNIAMKGFVMINSMSWCYFANFTYLLLNLSPDMHTTNMLFLSTWILVYVSKPTSLLNQVLLSLCVHRFICFLYSYCFSSSFPFTVYIDFVKVYLIKSTLTYYHV